MRTTARSAHALVAAKRGHEALEQDVVDALLLPIADPVGRQRDRRDGVARRRPRATAMAPSPARPARTPGGPRDRLGDRCWSGEPARLLHAGTPPPARRGLPWPGRPPLLRSSWNDPARRGGGASPRAFNGVRRRGRSGGRSEKCEREESRGGTVSVRSRGVNPSRWKAGERKVESRRQKAQGRKDSGVGHARHGPAPVAPFNPRFYALCLSDPPIFAGLPRLANLQLPLGRLEPLLERWVEAVAQAQQLDRVEGPLGDPLLHLHPAGAALGRRRSRCRRPGGG